MDEEESNEIADIFEEASNYGKYHVDDDGFYVGFGVSSSKFFDQSNVDKLASEFLQDESSRDRIRAIPLPPSPPQYFVQKEESVKKGTVITIEDARYIRRVVPSIISGREISRRYGISRIAVYRIVNGKTFREDRTCPGHAEARIIRKRTARVENELSVLGTRDDG